MSHPPRRLRRVLLATAVVVVPLALVAGGWWWWLGSHPLTHTLAGCDQVRNERARSSCFTTQITHILHKRGVKAGLAQVQAEADRLHRLPVECHLATHPVGLAAGRRAAHAASPVLPTVPSGSWCATGYQHGFLIGFLEQTGTSAQISRRAGELCAAQPDARNCIHAIGHVFGRKDPAVAKSSPHCLDAELAPLKRSDWDALRGECLYGLMMEVTFADVRAAHGRTSSLARDNCDASWPAQVLDACYGYLPARVSQLSGASGNGPLLHACTYAPKGRARDVCLQSLTQTIGSRSTVRLVAHADGTATIVKTKKAS